MSSLSLHQFLQYGIVENILQSQERCFHSYGELRKNKNSVLTRGAKHTFCHDTSLKA